MKEKEWEKLNDDGCHALVTAIVKQAKSDYLFGLKLMEKNKDGKAGREAVKDLRKFFRSNWFALLTNLDGEEAIKAIEREFKEKRKKKLPTENRHERPVKGVNIQTGEVVRFPSVSSASRELHISISALRSALAGRATQSNGYYWSYEEL